MYEWKERKSGERFELFEGDQLILSAYAQGVQADGQMIDTRTATLKASIPVECGLDLYWESDNGLALREELRVTSGVPTARCVLSRTDGRTVLTRQLIPLVIQDDRRESRDKLKLWKGLWTRMLTVPYDNDMWLRFEALPQRAGQVSYDLTMLMEPDSREGLLIGALEFDRWKNAVVCSAYDARCLLAVSGWADAGTHDTLPHGTLMGREVASAPFCALYGQDWRDLLETYGDLLKERQADHMMTWPEGNPFGFNSWAGLAWRLGEDNFRRTGAFLGEELRPAGFENQGISYVNLDACWHAIGEEGLKRLRDEQHARGQRCGIYDAPFAFFGKDENAPIPGVEGNHTFSEILLRDEQGKPLPRVDGSIPLDVTHPLWREFTRWKIDRFIAWGYEYVKVDFLSHGGMEGVHCDPEVRTGRQALNRGYRDLASLLDPKRVGYPFFLSLSIAPMLPGGWGHARRFSCDAFGTDEDIEYVLNTQTYGWWQNRRVYEFNDPDHIVLLRSFCMERDSTEGEARARYTSAVIAGGVMMISDDYDRPEAMDRARMFTTNRAVNEIARARADFRPVEQADAYCSRAFTARIGGRDVLALFAVRKETVTVDCARAGIPGGTWKDLWTGRTLTAADGVLTWPSDGCNAMLLVPEV